MRKVLAFVLLAGAAVPALAAGAPGDHQSRHRESGQQSASENTDSGHSANRQHADRGNRGSDSSAGSNDQPPPPQQQHHQQQQVIHVETNSGGDTNEGGQRFHHGVVSRISSGDEQPATQPTGGGHGNSDTVRIRHGSDLQPVNRGPKVIEVNEADSTPTLREQKRTVPGVFRNRVPVVSNTPHEGTQPPLRTEARRSAKINWSAHNWRDDKRYDWKDWRRRHRSHFHLGFYYDPFGWNYRPYQIGWRLWPSYYSSRYWLNDPYEYRLPYAPPGYRWIRYYDDAILIDTWNGQVVDVIYNFFW